LTQKNLSYLWKGCSN